MADPTPSRARSESAFLLTRQHYDGANGIEIVLWARGESGPVRLRFPGQEAVCFQREGALSPEAVGARSRPVELEALEGGAVEALYFPTQRALKDGRRIARDSGVRWYESDIKPADRFLMERFVTASFRVTGEAYEHAGFREYRAARIEPTSFRPELKLVSIDIETGGFDEDLYSVAVSSGETSHVFLVRADSWDAHHVGDRLANVSHSVHADERTALEELFAWIAHEDPDVLIGWNVIDFDLRFIERACERWNLGFSLGRGGERARLLRPSGLSGRRVAIVPGRAVLDGIDVLRTATWSFEDFGLGAVASELLGRTKLIEEESHEKVEKIRALYRDEPWELVRYNLEDCRLVEDVFEHAGLIGFALERAELTGLAFDRPGGAVAAFDNLYLPRLHRQGRVAPDVSSGDDEPSPGGFVMDSKPGLYENVLVLDFKSLYPSIIRTFLVDPLGLALRRIEASLVSAELSEEGAALVRGALAEARGDIRGALRAWDAAATEEAAFRADRLRVEQGYARTALRVAATREAAPRSATPILLAALDVGSEDALRRALLVAARADAPEDRPLARWVEREAAERCSTWREDPRATEALSRRVGEVAFRAQSCAFAADQSAAARRLGTLAVRARRVAAEAAFEIGERCRTGGNGGCALLMLRRALDRYPSHSRAAVGLAALLHEGGDDGGAREVLLDALRQTEGIAASQSRLGAAARELGIDLGVQLPEAGGSPTSTATGAPMEP